MTTEAATVRCEVCGQPNGDPDWPEGYPMPADVRVRYTLIDGFSYDLDLCDPCAEPMPEYPQQRIVRDYAQERGDREDGA